MCIQKLRHLAGLDVLKLVYYSLCQTIVTFCISVWGGAAKTILLQLERSQRAVLKVMNCKPLKYPTTRLHNECKHLTVRKMFVLQTVSRKHRTLQYNPENQNICSSYRFYPNVTFRSALAKPHFRIVAGHLYSTLNEYCGMVFRNINSRPIIISNRKFYRKYLLLILCILFPYARSQ